MTIIRDITLKAQKYFESPEILIFIGSRQAGKTTVLKQLQNFLNQENKSPHLPAGYSGRWGDKKTYFLNLEDPDYLALLNESPKNLFKIFPFDLKKRNFVFIDEIQYLKNPSNFLKYFYDEYAGRLKILASGSSAFYLDKKFKDSLAGRKKIFNVFTVSFREFLLFKNEEELSKKNFEELALSEKEKIELYYREYIIYGGYPRVVLAPLAEKQNILRDIVYSYIKKDIFEAHIRQEEIFYKLFKIFSAQIGNLLNASELANTLGVSKTTIDHYVYVMQKLFHIKLINPFYKNIRKELTKMPKVYFYDLGLRNFLVDNFSPYDLREDRGALLENAVFRQLLDIYDSSDIKFWRTTQKNEIDFIIKEKEAMEVKAQPLQFKEKNYKIFMENYKNFDLKIISLAAKMEMISRHKIIEAWKI